MSTITCHISHNTGILYIGRARASFTSDIMSPFRIHAEVITCHKKYATNHMSQITRHKRTERRIINLARMSLHWQNSHLLRLENFSCFSAKSRNPLALQALGMEKMRDKKETNGLKNISCNCYFGAIPLPLMALVAFLSPAAPLMGVLSALPSPQWHFHQWGRGGVISNIQ